MPASLGALTNFNFIGLNENQLSGPIPDLWGQMILLEGFYLNSNRLTGLVPIGFGDMTLMNQFYLNGNDFDNPVIPPAINNWYQQIPNKSITPQGFSDDIFYADFENNCGF